MALLKKEKKNVSVTFMSHCKAQKRGQVPSPGSASPASSEMPGPQEQWLTPHQRCYC